MTKEEALKVISEHKDAVNMVNVSHLGPLSPLVEVQIEVVTIRRDETVKMWASGGSSWMPSEAAVKRIGNAAGVQMVPSETNTRKEGAICWVGRAQGTRMAPAGGYELGPVGEYEWDVEIQIEVMKVKGKPGKNFVAYSDQELAENRVQFMKFGRQRANTGAVTRAILGAMSIKRGIKGLFSEDGRDDDTREIIISRIVQNTKNEMVLRASLESQGRVTQMLFGGRQAALPPVERSVEGSHTIVSESGTDSFGLDLGSDEGGKTQEARHQFLRRHLGFIAQKYQKEVDGSDADKKTSKHFLSASMDESIPEEQLEDWYKRVVNHLGKFGIDYHMENPE